MEISDAKTGGLDIEISPSAKSKILELARTSPHTMLIFHRCNKAWAFDITFTMGSFKAAILCQSELFFCLMHTQSRKSVN